MGARRLPRQPSDWQLLKAFKRASAKLRIMIVIVIVEQQILEVFVFSGNQRRHRWFTRRAITDGHARHHIRHHAMPRGLVQQQTRDVRA